MVDNVVPDGGEVPHELSLARLGIEVGDTGIEVVGAYGVSHGLVLVAELVAVLVVVLAVGHAVADSYQPLGQRQVFLVARLAVYLGGTHVVAGTDGVARQLGSVVGQEVVKEVGSLLAALEERGLACGALVYDAGGNEVPEVIGLEVQTRGKGVFLVLANLNACRILLDGMRVNACIAFGNDYWRVDVAIGTLGQCHLLDELVHQGVQLRVLGDGIDCGAGLEPFVHVAVVEWRSVVLALNSTGGYLEVGKAVTAVQSQLVYGLVGCVPGVPHRPDASCREHVETVAPEAARPLRGSHRQVLHHGFLASAHVGKTLRRGRRSACAAHANYEE